MGQATRRWAGWLVFALSPALAAGQPAEEPPPPPAYLPEAPVVVPAETAPAPPKGPPLLAGGPFGALLSPTVGRVPTLAEARFSWLPDQAVRDQPARLGVVQEGVSVLFPLYQDEWDEWSATVSVRGEQYDTDAVLPDTDQPFPDQLWQLRFGANYRRRLPSDTIVGGGLQIGSASDRPFHDLGSTAAVVTAFARVPSGDRNAWLFTLFYSTTSELPFPIPGVSYLCQPSDRFLVNIGLPFLLVYRPTDDLTLDLSYLVLRTVRARATYRLAPPVRVYGGFEWANESYFRADRRADDDRLFYYDKRLVAGVQWFLTRAASVDLAGGYAFDRFYFEGRDYDDRRFNRVDVESGPFVTLQFQARW